MTIIYGIKNCDTMKKALQWLDDHNVTYIFHDYKKDGVPQDVIARAIKAHGWDTVINRRGTTWRTLPAPVRDGMNDHNACRAACDNPSLIKRPLLVHEGQSHIGFASDMYAEIF